MSNRTFLRAIASILIFAGIACAVQIEPDLGGTVSAALERDPNLTRCCNDDGPGCFFCAPDGFKNGGAWDPSGAWIQDIAYDTVGTEESCWDDTGEDGSGKPFYQMRLGINSWDDAKTVSCLLQSMENDPMLAGIAALYTRQAWCSETISYWHHEAGIPYAGGYCGGDWLYDWQLYNTTSLILFYAVEELTGGTSGIPGTHEARGRWIDWSDLDYDNFQLGVNAPLPGSYVCIHCYHNGQFGDHGHSMMIDEMTIYRTISGKVSRVHVNLLEGNTAVGVNCTRVMDDLISVVPGGDGFFDDCSEGGDMRIVGFGVDLDEDGDPICDPSRLHYVTVTEAAPAPLDAVVTSFPRWDTTYAPLVSPLADYAKAVRQAGGVKVTSNVSKGGFAGIPDGNEVQWHFSQTAKKTNPREGGDDPAPTVIDIDLVAEHPIPIKALMLKWAPGHIPQGYHVLWAGGDKDYRGATVANLSQLEGFSDELNFAVPVLLHAEGAHVRYIRFVFAPETFTHPATLERIRIIHQWGQDTDMPVDRSRGM